MSRIDLGAPLNLAVGSPQRWEEWRFDHWTITFSGAAQDFTARTNITTARMVRFTGMTFNGPISQFGVSQRWIQAPREAYEMAIEGLVARVTSDERRDWDLSRQTVDNALYDRIRSAINRWRRMLT